MGLQMILCVEADRRSRTDNIYIKETLDKFYNIGTDVNVNYINMGGKSRYMSKDVSRQINQFSRDYKLGDTVVIICIDADYLENNAEHMREYNDILSYTDKHGYELIWFCHDIEEVYVGNQVSDKLKKDRAVEFKKRKEIDKVDTRRISSRTMTKSSSNILIVFDRYLNRK